MHRTSKSGIARKGNTRSGRVRLKKSCKAYSSSTRAAGKQYDGHNGKQAVIVWGRLDDSGRAVNGLKPTIPLIRKTAENNYWIQETEASPLPSFIPDTRKDKDSD